MLRTRVWDNPFSYSIELNRIIFKLDSFLQAPEPEL